MPAAQNLKLLLTNMNTLSLILGDQLNYKHSWTAHVSTSNTFIIMEMRQETDYVPHHAQKVIGFFAAMYNYANYLRKLGHKVIHLPINHPENKQTLAGNLTYWAAKLQCTHFRYQLPDEYRLNEQLSNWCAASGLSCTVADTEHFYTTRTDLALMFPNGKAPLMETFYRNMRKRFNVLMNNDKPEGGQWNFDTDNRNPYKGADPIPLPLIRTKDYSVIWQEIQTAGIKTIGEPMADKYPWPTTCRESVEILRYFITTLLPLFGKYQDAMHTASWSMWHSRLSFSLNTKMLAPQEVVDAAVAAWHTSPTTISLAQVEGFVRQILGWREYVRGIYWLKMPDYATTNFFNNTATLPTWFWSGHTRMKCLSVAIGQSLKYAYAHHIQRLMLTGNFALLAGIHPALVDEWYLGIYIDAIEWVEMPNTRGMSQFADGGFMATKPYVSAAAYINKMSNYCKSCYYKPDVRIGPQACPFNSLYWSFLLRHTPQLASNRRMAVMLNMAAKMTQSEKDAILAQADKYLNNMNEL